jgi:hypothetical protein
MRKDSSHAIIMLTGEKKRLENLVRASAFLNRSPGGHNVSFDNPKA